MVRGPELGVSVQYSVLRVPCSAAGIACGVFRVALGGFVLAPQGLAAKILLTKTETSFTIARR